MTVKAEIANQHEKGKAEPAMMEAIGFMAKLKVDRRYLPMGKNEVYIQTSETRGEGSRKNASRGR